MDLYNGIVGDGEPFSDWPTSTQSVSIQTPDVTLFAGFVLEANVLNVGEKTAGIAVAIVDTEGALEPPHTLSVAPGAIGSTTFSLTSTAGTLVVFSSPSDQLYASFNVINADSTGHTFVVEQIGSDKFETFEGGRIAPFSIGHSPKSTAVTHNPSEPGVSGPFRVAQVVLELISNHDDDTASPVVWATDANGTVSTSQKLTIPAGQTGAATFTLTPGIYNLGVCPNGTRISIDAVVNAGSSNPTQITDHNFFRSKDLVLSKIPGCS